MKKILALSLLALTTMFTSCSSDSDGGSSTAMGSLKAKVDGQNWTAGMSAAQVIEADWGEGSGLALQILGTKTDGTSIAMVIPLTTLSEGSHTFSGFDAEGYIDYGSMSDDFYSDEDGGTFTVNITDLDVEAGKVSGTFSGTLVSWEGDTTMSITEGEFNDIILVSQSFYSDGSMSLSKDGGASFEMDEDDSDSKYLLMNENSVGNSVTLIGYNTVIGDDFGIYTLSIPLDATPGTYSFGDGDGFEAGLGSTGGGAPFEVTSGSITITAHANKNLVGTFHFTANDGSATVNITNGTFNVTHK